MQIQLTKDQIDSAPGCCLLCREIARGEYEDDPEPPYVGNHFACSSSPDEIMLALEDAGLASCHLDGGRWRWTVAAAHLVADGDDDWDDDWVEMEPEDDDGGVDVLADPEHVGPVRLPTIELFPTARESARGDRAG